MNEMRDEDRVVRSDLVEAVGAGFDLGDSSTCASTTVRPKPRRPDLHHERYTVAEASQLLGMHPDVIRHAISAGELKAERAGHNVICIERKDLLAWLARR